MDARIGAWRRHYRLHTAADAAPAVAAGLDEASAAALASLGARLDEALGDDPTVYVARAARAVNVVFTGEPGWEGRAAARWGERMAAAVLARLARGEDVVTFPDQAAYVARFIIDARAGAQAGTPWRWYYTPFAHLRGLPLPDLLRTALDEHRDDAPRILAHLLAEAALDDCLAGLGAAGRREAWARLRGADDAQDADAHRRPFAAALELADRLDAWTARPEREALFAAYVASRPAPVDWRDRAGLAAAALTALRWLVRQGYARFTTPALPAALDLADFDWLDTDLLAAGLEELAVEAASVARPRRGPTPRHLALLADLAAAVRAAGVTSAADHEGLALRLYAGLLAHAPGWARDPIATAVIDRLVAAARAGPAGDAPAASALVAGWGADAAQVIAALTAAARGAARPEPRAAPAESLPDEAEDGFASEGAGAALLLRSLLDTRCLSVARGADWPAAGEAGASALRAALLLRWASGQEDSAWLDPALATLAGLEAPYPLAELRAVWAAESADAAARFAAGWLATLAGQRLLGDGPLHLHRIALPRGGNALVGGGGSPALHPLGALLDGASDPAAIVTDWLASWEAATGAPPEVVAADAETAAAAQRAGARIADDAALAGARAGDAERLAAALTTLWGPSLGAGADLRVALLAENLIRAWARWLRQFGGSGVPYLFEQFVWRPGRVVATATGVTATLARRPLDVALETAGYLADLNAAPWLPGGRLLFRLREMP